MFFSKLLPPCRCPLKCFEKVTEEQRNIIFDNFYGMTTKNEQDIYLQGLIVAKEVSRRRKRREGG